jgi:hypothetical protein
MRAASDIGEAASAGKQIDYLTRAHIRGESGYAAKLVRDTADALVSICVASSFAEASSIKQMCRDASVATRHAMLATAPDLEIYGRTATKSRWLPAPLGSSPFILHNQRLCGATISKVLV